MIAFVNHRPVARIVATLAFALVLGLTGCGYKGPLYLVPKANSSPTRMPVMQPFGLPGEEGPLPPFYEEDPSLTPAPIIFD